MAAVVVAYALSPIDLILDVIPVIGYLDDLILAPLGIMLLLRMIPPVVLIQCRKNAEEAATGENTPESRVVAIVIVVIWVLLGILAVVWIKRIL